MEQNPCPKRNGSHIWIALNQHLEICGACGDERPRTTTNYFNRVELDWELLRYRRKDLGFTLQELSRRMNHKSAETVRRWEKGNRIPNVVNYAKLCQALSVPFGFALKFSFISTEDN